MSSNGLYDDKLEKILSLVMDVDKNTRETGNQTLNVLQSIAADCRSTAQSTLATASSNTLIASSLDRLQGQNNQQVQLIAGKWQVPMPVFLIVLMVFGALIMMEKSSQTKTELKITPGELQITQQDKNERRDSQTGTKEATGH